MFLLLVIFKSVLLEKEQKQEQNKWRAVSVHTISNQFTLCITEEIRKNNLKAVEQSPFSQTWRYKSKYNSFCVQQQWQTLDLDCCLSGTQRNNKPIYKTGTHQHNTQLCAWANNMQVTAVFTIWPDTSRVFWYQNTHTHTQVCRT